MAERGQDKARQKDRGNEEACESFVGVWRYEVERETRNNVEVMRQAGKVLLSIAGAFGYLSREYRLT